jgi:carbon storage regulator CsrA
MLVLSRRESDRIVFPALGISVEVMKIGRSRVSIGVHAPKGIRVIRHELAGEEKLRPSSEGLDAAVRQRIDGEFQNQVDAATEKLQIAQDELVAGNTQRALATLGQALAELDRLRHKAQSVCDEVNQVAPVKTSVKTSDLRPSMTQNAKNQTETVAEPSTGYSLSNAGNLAAAASGELPIGQFGPQGRQQSVDLKSDRGRRGYHVGYRVDLAGNPFLCLMDPCHKRNPKRVC